MVGAPKFAFLYFLLVLGFFPEISQASQPIACAELLLDQNSFSRFDPSSISRVRPDFKHTKKYTQELESTDIKNQCGWGGCWGYSLSTVLEHLARNESHIKVKLDPQFLVAMQILTRSLQAITRYGFQFNQAEYLGYTLALAQTYGVIPQGVWKPKVDITQPQITERFDFYINHIVQKYQTRFNEITENKKPALLSAAQKEMMDLVESVLGPLPKTFKFAGETYSPVTFAYEVLNLSDLGAIEVSPKIERVKAPEGFFGQAWRKGYRPKYDHVEMQVPLKDLETIIIEEIDSGKPVWFTSEWQRAFMDYETGIMSLAAFENPFPEMKIDRSHRDVFANRSSHAVVIVGYELGKDGRVTKYKVQNSHGVKSGDAGYFHMYRDYFENFVTEIVLLRPKAYLAEMRKNLQLP